ncbi:MAG: hypothetical protein WD830_08740 [Chloroflexota bacterium]
MIGLTGCGPTAEVLTTATPPPTGAIRPTGGGQPTEGGQPSTSSGPSATVDPSASQAPPTDGTSTGIPLVTPTPFSGPVWEALADYPAGEAFEVTSVTSLVDGGFAAVGFQPIPGEGFFGRQQGVTWTSVDGRTWQSAVDAAFQFATLEDVVEFGGAIFVFGTIETCNINLSEDCVEPPDSGSAAWRQTAGAAWERLPLPLSMQSGTMAGVVAANDHLLAFGWTGDEARSVVWTSVDGVTWSETADLAGMDPVSAMSAGPTGVVAFGNRLASELGDLELLATVSGDFNHFGRVDAPALASTIIQSVTMGGSGLVAVGDSDDEDFNLNGVALHSADGLAWTQTSAPDGSFAGASLLSVHAVPNGYVALGRVPLLDEFGVVTGGSWFSSDGLSWRRLAPFGERFTELDTSAAGTTGIVAFTVTQEESGEESVISTISAWFAPIEALAGQ